MSAFSLKKAALIALLAGSAAAASATTVTVSQDLLLGQTYGSNGANLTYTSAFDAAAALGTSDFGAQYVVNSATVSFTWTDNSGDSYSLTSSTPWSRSYGDYYLTGTSCCINYYFHRSETGSQTSWYATPSESASVAFGDKVVESGSSSTISTTSSNTVSNYTGLDSRVLRRIRPLTYYYYYTDYHDTTTSVYTDHTGTFAIGADLLALGGSDVSSFLSSGILPFAMTMTGDAILTGATLTLDVAPAVPEPETYAMMLAGLGVVGFLSRRRPRARA